MIFSKVITLLVTVLYSKNGVLADSENLSLCAFNLQIFGDTKFGRESLGVQIYIDQSRLSRNRLLPLFRPFNLTHA